MRLKNIKLSGFKSFVDPTTIPFERDLVAVVGPNGCGKSNVVDAIRWVMGESSAKTLRGESMSDVIFNGSSTRKPIGQASVQLTFDNSDSAIGGQYAEYAEIAVKRVASRDGTSDYYLNNVKCRRKDITDVFLGTGLGPRSYSVIEQGMISRFIEAKPEELRSYLEEAAGISKYKERRRETETRIRHTRENLDRVQDLRDEIAKQLEKLERQANAAERYKILKEEERLHKAQLLALQWQTLDAELTALNHALQTADVAIESKVAEQRRLGLEIEQQRESQHDSSDVLNDVQGRYYALGAEIAKIEQSIVHHKERYQQLQEDKSRIEESTAELQENKKVEQERTQLLQAELREVDPEYKKAIALLENMQQRLHDVELTEQAWRQQWNEFTQEAAKTIKLAEVEQTRIQYAEQTIRACRDKINRLTQEQQTLATAAEADAELELLRSQQIELANEQQALQQQQQEIAESLIQQREHNETYTTRWNEIKEKIQALKGRQASLLALQQSAQQESGVNEWLAKQHLDKLPRVLNQIKVQAGWEKAVETVLGSYLQAICVDETLDLTELLAQLPQGNLALWLKNNRNNTSSHPNSLAQQVSGLESIKPFLQSIYCAPRLADALLMREKLAAHESVITPEGIWLGAHWVRINQAEDAQLGMIAREQELSVIENDLADYLQQVQQLEDELNAGRERLQFIETERDGQQRSINQLHQQIADVRAKLHVKQQQIEQRNIREDRVSGELAEQMQLLENAEQNLQESRNTWQAAIGQSEQYANQRVVLEQQGQEYSDELFTYREKIREQAETKHRLDVRTQQLTLQIEALNENIIRADKQLELLFARSANLSESLAEGEGPVYELQEKLNEVLHTRVAVEEELTEIRTRVDAVNYQIRQLEETKDQLVDEIEMNRRAVEEQRITSRTLEVRKNTYLEQMTELNYDLATIAQNIPADANVPVWQEESERIANRIARLGPINLAAIEEFQLQKERKDYLDAQSNDLNQALETLESAIQKIDRETRVRFKETFDKVNEEFQRLFPKVFGGGSAYIEILGEDLLDTGIGVIARPPGKRNSSIHLLSGGEKALTAISLVFSIFQLNPAPFCLLDEVDAPLDDANVGRFCTLVKEMSSKVQFVFITHNKVAMEMAQQLTGVTMHEPGVSRIVAVDMEEAVKLAAA